MKELKLSEIRIDGGTQPRAHISTDLVSEYAERIEAGDVFPSSEVVFDGKDYWLWEGFHRYHGHAKAGKKTMSCNVRQGTLRDAILFSCGANSSHGLRRTNEDKRSAVTRLLQDIEWSKNSDRWIAEQAGVSDRFVASVRPEVRCEPFAPETDAAETQDETRHYDDSESQIEPEREPPKRTGRDGKKYPAKRKPDKGAKKKPPKEQPEAGGYEPHEAAKPLTKMDALFSKVMEQYSLAEKILGKADPLLKEVHSGLDSACKALAKLRTKLRRAG